MRSRRRLLAGPLGLIALALILGSVLFMAGGSAHGQQPLVSTSPVDIAAGEQLYVEHCESCHGYQGKGGVPGAPALVNVGAAAADFYLCTGRMPLNNPANEPLRHKPYFNPQQIRELVAYVNALPQITGMDTGGPTIPTVAPLCPTATPDPDDPGCVTLSQGQQEFAVNCGQCHQARRARGNAVQGQRRPRLHNANLTQIAEAIRIGPAPMPVFGPPDERSGDVVDRSLCAVPPTSVEPRRSRDLALRPRRRGFRRGSSDLGSCGSPRASSGPEDDDHRPPRTCHARRRTRWRARRDPDDDASSASASIRGTSASTRASPGPTTCRRAKTTATGATRTIPREPAGPSCGSPSAGP